MLQWRKRRQGWKELWIFQWPRRFGVFGSFSSRSPNRWGLQTCHMFVSFIDHNYVPFSICLKGLIIRPWNKHLIQGNAWSQHREMNKVSPYALKLEWEFQNRVDSKWWSIVLHYYWFGFTSLSLSLPPFPYREITDSPELRELTLDQLKHFPNLEGLWVYTP